MDYPLYAIKGNNFFTGGLQGRLAASRQTEAQVSKKLLSFYEQGTGFQVSAAT